MINSEVRLQIHKLVDEANEQQLDAVLEALKPYNNRYTQDEINCFYNRIKLIEESESSGSSVAEAHANIRSKYNEKYGA